jgi:hypothetical protein
VGEGDERAGDTSSLSKRSANMMKVEKRFSRRATTNFQSEPGQGLANPCAESFGSGFLCSKACGEWDGGSGLSSGIFDFGRVKNLFEESIPKAVQGLLNSVDLDKIHAQAEDLLVVHFFVMA